MFRKESPERVTRDMKHWRVFFLIGIIFLLSACGTVGAVGTAAPAPTRSGGQSSTPTAMVLQVVRAPSTRLNPAYPGLQRTITDTATVNQLYQMALALPSAPPGIIHCPVDFDVTYQLTFNQGPQGQQQMTLDATGCRFLHLAADPYHTKASTEAFRAQLARMLGVSSLVPGTRQTVIPQTAM